MKLNSPGDGSLTSVWGLGNAPGGVSLVLSLGKMSVSPPGKKGEDGWRGAVTAVRKRHSIFFSLLVSLMIGWHMFSITSGRKRKGCCLSGEVQCSVMFSDVRNNIKYELITMSG